MDAQVVETLASAGLDPTLEQHRITIGIRMKPPREVAPVEGAAMAVAGDHGVPVRLRPISELWEGDARPPDFSRGPTPPYVLFFATIERTATDYCACTGRRVRDREFERLYDHLRRRPDGTDANPLFSYLQAAAALYMSLRPVSRAEFEAVVRRLAKSARTFTEDPASRNYLDLALSEFL